MEKIRAVIFDWGGVLIEDPAPALFKYCAKALSVSVKQYRIAFNICMNDFQTGRVTEQQFWQNMTNRLKVPMPEYFHRRAQKTGDGEQKTEDNNPSSVIRRPSSESSLWGEAFDAVYTPRTELFTLAARLQQAGCKTAILSNTEKPAVELIRKQKYNVFDVEVFSCLEGITKPDRKIYDLTLARLGTPAGRTLFIDDKQDFIDGAKRAGLQTVLFKNIDNFKKDIARLFPDIV
ncbi:MAG: HAD family phosphatase [Sedimentisphaerales bacterium]